jgi:taurine dioxygenase
MEYQRIAIERAEGALGATVRGVDLRKALDTSTAAEIRHALGEYGVVFFREQQLTPEHHLAFAEACGEINVNRFFTPVEGYPRIAEVRKEPDQKVNVGGGWHTDHSYDEIPALGSILLGLEVPEVGGDTMFASMYGAYEGLSDGLKQTLRGLNAVHSSRHVFGKNARVSQADGDRFHNADRATQDAVHPVVIAHPETGRSSLYVNPGFTLHFEGWSAGESAPLLQYLYEQATREENTTRFQWEPGSIAMWDNRCTWHYALNDYHGHRRLMHRVTLEGVPLRAAD